MSSEVITIVHNDLHNIVREMRNAGGVKFGFMGGQYPDGTKVVDVAIANEFGTNTVPERPFFRISNNENSGSYASILREAASRGQYRTGLAVCGQKAVGDIQESIVSLSDPANAQSTIERKGSSNPLIDTGRLRQSVSYELF